LKKRSKKLLYVGPGLSGSVAQREKSFLVLFFKKELLSSTAETLSTLIFTFILYLLIGMLFATLPPFVRNRLGYTAVIAGAAISLQYVTTFISRPAAGRTADRLGPKTAVTRGFAICTLSMVFLLLATLRASAPAQSLAILGVSRLLLGVAESFAGTGTIAWGAARLGAAQMGRVLSWNGMLSYGGMALGAPFGVAIVNGFGPAGLGLACTAIAAAGWLTAALRAPAAPAGGEAMGFGAVLLRVLPYGGALALASTGFGTIAAFVTLLYQAHGWTGAAYALTSFGLCFATFRFVLTGVLARYGGLRVALAAMGVETIGLVSLSLAGTAAAAAGSAAVTGLGFSPMFPALGVEAVQQVPAASRGAAIGTYNLFADVAMVFVGPAAGVIATSAGYGAVYLAAAGCVGLAAAIVVTLAATRRRARGLAA
jgi:MFS family permease